MQNASLSAPEANLFEGLLGNILRYFFFLSLSFEVLNAQVFKIHTVHCYVTFPSVSWKKRGHQMPPKSSVIIREVLPSFGEAHSTEQNTQHGDSSDRTSESRVKNLKSIRSESPHEIFHSTP